MQNDQNSGGKTEVIIAIIVLLVITTSFVAYKKGIFSQLIGSKQSSSVKTNNNTNALLNNELPVNNNENEEGIANEVDESEEDFSDEEKRSPEKANESLRQGIISYAMSNLNKLVPPPKGDKWDIPVFYFVGNSNVYLELYGYDTELTGLKLLYKVEREGNGFKFTELARYKEGKEDWVLTSGNDSFSDYVIEEYDLNEDTNKWEKTDEFTDESIIE
jgi:hypothetical protein